MYITLTEDYSEIKYEPKTGKAEGFDFGIKDFLTGSDGTADIPLPCSTDRTLIQLARSTEREHSRKVKGSNNQRTRSSKTGCPYP